MSKCAFGLALLCAALLAPSLHARALEPKITWGFSGTTLYAPTHSDLGGLEDLYPAGIGDPIGFWSAESVIEACLADASGSTVDWDYQLNEFFWHGVIPPNNNLMGQTLIGAAGSATGNTVINIASQVARDRIVAGGGTLPSGWIYSGIASAGTWLGRNFFANLSVA